jgi:glutamate dehydrogenase (NAD(P)+)
MRDILVKSYAEVHALSEERDVSLRTAAQMIGVGRVAEAHRTRGLYP